MFRTVRRIIGWCGAWKKNLYLGFVCSFLSAWFGALPVMTAAYTVGLLLESARSHTDFDRKWILLSLLILAGTVLLRFAADYMRARLQEVISYELAARDRLAVGAALKRVSMGYFQQVNTGNILNAVTTGLNTLETMGMRMVDTFVGGYLNFLCIFLCLAVINPLVSLIALAGGAASFGFLVMVSRRSRATAADAFKAGQKLSSAVLEYARGLPVVKSFGQGGASIAAMRAACRENRDIRLKIEWGYTPANCMHLLALKTASAAMAAAACFLGMKGELDFPLMLMLAFFSFHIFAGLEPISDSAHVLGVIGNAMDQLDALKAGNYIDRDGRDISPEHYDVEFRHVDFGYDSRAVLNDVSFRVPEGSLTAIVGPSGSGKTTICSLIARFYDVNRGQVLIGGHDVREFTCDSLMENFSIVFQNVYLFHDTIRNNICFGKPDVSEAEMIQAAKKARCHDFIMALPMGYDTVVGEGGGTLSGGEKQRISIARAILKDAPIIILDEATASIDPENEHLIQAAISELTKGKTIITIAHRLATIEQADQILVVDDGKIVQSGTHEELIKETGRYRSFAEARKRAEGWKL